MDEILQWLPFAIPAMGYLAGNVFDWPASPIKATLKCAPIAALAMLCFLKDAKNDVAQYVATGLVLSMVGDACLVFTDNGENKMAFFCGMGVFGLAHFCYVKAMWNMASWRQMTWRQVTITQGLTVAALAMGRASVKLIIPTPALEIALVAYGVVIGVMFWSAAQVWYRHRASWANRAALTGAALFALSDTILCLVMFSDTIQPHRGHLLVMATYYLAQSHLAYFATHFKK